MTVKGMRWPAAAVGTGLALGASAALYRIWLRRSGAADPQRVGYLPLGTLKALADDIWIVDDVMNASGLVLPIRMTIIRLANGDLLLHSPTPLSEDLVDSVAVIGKVRHIIAPTFAHWTNVAAWQQAYPDATTWGVPGLRDRGQVKRSGTRIDVDLADEAPPQWRDQVVQGIIAGNGAFRECWFFHEATQTLVLCDLIENLEPAKLPPVTRLAAWAFAGTHASTALHVRTALMLAGGQTREAVAAMVALEPVTVVFAHGDIFASGGDRRLRQAFAWLI